MSELIKKVKEVNIKEIIISLKKDYKYVRFITLNTEMKFENNIKVFKRFLLCSNILEECLTSQEEIDNIDSIVLLGHVGLKFFEMLEEIITGENIPVLELFKNI